MRTALTLVVVAVVTLLCSCEVIDDASIFHVVGEDGATLSDGARPSKDTLFGDASALPSIDGATGDDLSAVVDAASLETDLVMPDLVMPDLVMPDLAPSPDMTVLPASCLEIKLANPNATDGTFTVYLNGDPKKAWTLTRPRWRQIWSCQI